MGEREGHPPRLVTGTFVLVGLASLFYFIADGILLPTVPTYVDGPLRGDDVAVGIVVGAFAVTALLLRPLAGLLADRRGRRPVMVAGAAAFALAALGYTIATSVPLMVAFRLISGAGEALFFVGAAAAISDIAPEERRGEALSLFSLALYAGIGIGPVIGEVAVRGADYTWAWLAAAAAAGVAVVAGAAARVPRLDLGGGRTRLVHPAGVLPGLVIFANTAGMAGYFAFTPLYAREIGMGSSRFVFVSLSVIVILIRSFGAKLPDRLGPRTASRAALGISAAGFVVMGAWRAPAGLFAGTAIFAVGIALATPALMTLSLAGAVPAERGSIMGTFTAFLDLAFGLGPVLLGVVADRAGYPATYLAAGAISLAGLALLFTPWALRRTARSASARG